MKLRLKGDTVRLRLTQSEVRQLAEGLPVQLLTRIDLATALLVRLQTWHLAVASVALHENTMEVQVPATETSAWAGNDQEGLEFRIDNGFPEGLLLWVEKDFNCLKPRPGEDESDHFPHPGASASRC
jgi:hypothetical protein